MKLGVSCVYVLLILSIGILKDYGTSKWTLKHKVTTLELFGKKNIEIGTEVCDAAYRVIRIHPEWILIFLVGEDKYIGCNNLGVRLAFCTWIA
jgi:hypothetical protein